MGRVTNHIVAQIRPTSLTTPAYRWLHEEAWEDGHKAKYQQFRQSPPAGIYATPAVVGRRKPGSPFAAGRWLLTPPASADTAAPCASAAVEVQLQKTQFERVLIYVSQHGDGSWLAKDAQAALTMLISGLIMLTKADRLRIIPLDQAVGQALLDLQLPGTPVPLLAPLSTLAMLAGAPLTMRLPAIDIDPTEWWTHPFAATERATLGYLEKRDATAAKNAALRQRKPRRRGLLGLFSRRG